MEKPDVDSIDGLSPAIAIDQKTAPRNPRSTVGTVTEIYDFLRLLFAKVGTPHCPKCGDPIKRQTPTQIAEEVTNMKEGTKILIMSPMVRDKKGQHEKILEKIKKEGFVRVRVDGEIYPVTERFDLDENKKHSIEIVVDRLVVKDLKKQTKKLSSGEEIDLPNPNRTRLADSVETALKHGSGLIIVQKQRYERRKDLQRTICLPKMQYFDPRNFSSQFFIQQPARSLPGMSRSRHKT